MIGRQSNRQEGRAKKIKGWKETGEDKMSSRAIDRKAIDRKAGQRKLRDGKRQGETR